MGANCTEYIVHISQYFFYWIRNQNLLIPINIIRNQNHQSFYQHNSLPKGLYLNLQHLFKFSSFHLSPYKYVHLPITFFPTLSIFLSIFMFLYLILSIYISHHVVEQITACSCPDMFCCLQWRKSLPGFYSHVL